MFVSFHARPLCILQKIFIDKSELGNITFFSTTRSRGVTGPVWWTDSKASGVSSRDYVCIVLRTSFRRWRLLMVLKSSLLFEGVSPVDELSFDSLGHNPSHMCKDM